MKRTEYNEYMTPVPLVLTNVGRLRLALYISSE